MASSTGLIHNDEPTGIDKLNRDQYAEAFARLAESCDTPLVVGLYGTWGIGKTSLMKLIETKLDQRKTKPVWFDPWQHQFDENPALSLLHTVIDTFEMQEEARKLMTVIAAAFGSVLLKATVNLNAQDLQKFGEQYEQERFLVREKRVQLRKHFEELIEKVRRKQLPEGGRLVFFIDDLDRCAPETVLRLLEALKLYLNLPNCVYFLGVDRETLEESIRLQYKDVKLNQVSYLDKIVQLPFDIPPIPVECMEDFVTPLLGEDLQGCKELLVEGLGDNPRQIKRFINTLTLCHALAKNLSISGYDPCLLCLVLLIRSKSASLYAALGSDADILGRLTRGPSSPDPDKLEEHKALREKYLSGNEALARLLQKVQIPEEPLPREYVFLTRAARVEVESQEDYTKGVDRLERILAEHKDWLMSDGQKGSCASLSNANLRGAKLGATNLGSAYLEEADLHNASLMATNLNGADLRNADLTGANLMDARLTGADLSGANLRRADLTGADLGSADLRRSSGLTPSQLAKAKTLYHTELDQYLLKEVQKQYPRLLEEPKPEPETEEKPK